MAGQSASAIKAGEAFVELNADDKKFKQILDRNKDRFMKFAGVLRNAGLGLVGIGVGILTPLVTASVASLKFLDSIQDIADRTNSTTEAVSRLAYAAKLSASSIEDVEAADKVLTRATLAAIQGSEEQADAFKRMRISAEEFADLDIDQRFFLIAQTLEGINDNADRAQFLTALLGKNASTMLPLLSGGAEGLRDMFEEAEKLGAVVKGEDARKAAATMDAFDKVMTSLKSTLIEVGIAVLTLGDDTEDGLSTVLMYLKMARDWIKENKQLVATLAIIGGVLVAVGGSLVVAGMIVGSITALVTGLIIAIKAAIVVLGLITFKLLAIGVVIAVIIAVIAGLIYVFVKFTDLGKKMVATLSAGWNQIAENFKIMWNGILGALRKGDFQALGRILVVGFLVAFQIGIRTLYELWYDFTNFFYKKFFEAVAAIKVAFYTVITAIGRAAFSTLSFIITKSAEMLEKLNVFDIDIVKDAITKMRKFRDELDKTADNIGKAVIKVEFEENESVEELMRTRKRAQETELKNQQDDIDNNNRLLKRLAEKANEKPPVVPKLPIAPMPRLKGVKLEDRLDMLGDSTKGLFSSSDYRGALALGEANEYAKRSLDVQKGILDELKAINTKIEPAAFI